MEEINTEEIKLLYDLLNFSSWDNLNTSQKKKAWNDKRNSFYYSHTVFSPEGLPPMLCFKKVGKGYKSDYILNLRTLKPTKNSPIKRMFKTEILGLRTAQNVALNAIANE